MQSQFKPVLRAEAARMLGVSTATIRNWERSGKLRPSMYTASGVRIYDRRIVERLAAERAAGT